MSEYGTGRSNKIHVMFPKAPGEGKGNPYRPLLYGALQAREIEVSWTKGFILPYLRAVIHQGLPDIIHVQWQDQLFFGRNIIETIVRTFQFFGEMAVLKSLGVKYVWTVHNLRNHPGRYLKWEFYFSKILRKRVDKVVIHCEAIRSKVAIYFDIPNQKIEVAQHGHYRDWYPDAINRELARNELGLPGDKKIYLYFGKILKYKGVDTLIKEFRKLAGNQAVLIIAGKPNDETLRKEIIDLAEDASQIIVRLDYLNDDQLVQYLCASNVVVLPYRDILLSGSVILASSFARPVITPVLGCQYAMPEKGMFFYDPFNSEGLLNALQNSLGVSISNLDTMGQLLYEYSIGISWDRTAKQLRDTYESLLGF